VSRFVDVKRCQNLIETLILAKARRASSVIPAAICCAIAFLRRLLIVREFAAEMSENRLVTASLSLPSVPQGTRT
jgi:hypothetical protein